MGRIKGRTTKRVTPADYLENCALFEKLQSQQGWSCHKIAKQFQSSGATVARMIQLARTPELHPPIHAGKVPPTAILRLFVKLNHDVLATLAAIDADAVDLIGRKVVKRPLNRSDRFAIKLRALFGQVEIDHFTGDYHAVLVRTDRIDAIRTLLSPP